MNGMRELHAEDLLDSASGIFYNLVTQEEFSFGLHTHDFYELFLVVHGRAIHVINGRRETIGEGTLVLIRPSDAHAYESLGKNQCRFINVAFSSGFMKDLLHYAQDDELAHRMDTGERECCVKLADPDALRLKERLEALLLLSRQEPGRIRLLFRLVLAEVLLLLLPQAEGTLGARRSAWLSDLLVRMQEKSCLAEGLSAMVRISGKSTAALGRAFRKELGTTPTEHINAMRLHYAASLLVHSRMDVLGICMEAGFGNASHFHHLFRKRYGISPLRYRQAHGRSVPV